MEYDDLCAVNATCTNSIGTYQCSCNAGFTGDGVTCSESTLKHISLLCEQNIWLGNVGGETILKLSTKYINSLIISLLLYISLY